MYADAPFLPVISKRLKRRMSDHEGISPQQKGASHGSLDSSAAPSSFKPAPSKAIPPIILQDNEAYARILRDIWDQLQKTALEAKVQGNNVKIIPTSSDSFRFIQSYLQQRNTFFHTFAVPDERELKVVLEGVPYATPTNDVHAELLALFFFSTSVSLLHVAKKRFVNSFLIKLRKIGFLKKIYEVGHLLYLRVCVMNFDTRPVF